MEQHMQYLMWLKSKQILKSHYQASMNSFNNSWEEQAFAEDVEGPLGGFVWPPRSYSCAFCGREFRSAQALGGHMNVHRRDRARLKQSLSLQTDEVQLENHKETPSTLLGTQHLPQGGGVSSPFSSSASRASSKITQENSSVQSYVSPPFSSFASKEQQRWLGYPSSPLGSDSNSGRLLSISNSRTASGKCTRKEELITLDHEHTVETNLSVGINLGGSRNLQLGSDNEETINTKRRKSTALSSFAFFHKPCSSDRYVFQPEVLRIKTNSLEDIDLELRLGDPPAVKVELESIY